MSFGEAFVSAYTATTNALENKRRGLREDAAEGRAQQKFEQDKADHDRVLALADEMTQSNLNFYAEQQAAGRAASQQPATPASAGLQPPPSAANTAPAAPPASPGDGDQASVNQAAAPRTAALVAPPGVGGPSPSPSAPPPGAGPTAAAAAAVAGAPPPRTSQRTTSDMIEAANDHVAKITAMQVKMLALTHPKEAVELANAVRDPALQERMQKMSAFAAIHSANSADPSLNGLLTAIDPTAKPGSLVPHAPDKDGNQYSEYTRVMPDGSEVIVPVNPATIRMTLVGTLSGPKILEQAKEMRIEKQKDEELATQKKNYEDTRDYYNRHLTEGIRHNKAEEGIQWKNAETAATSKADRDEDKKDKRLANQRDAAVKTAMSLTDYQNGMKLDPEATQKNFSDLLTGVEGLGTRNGIDFGNPAAFARLAAVMTKIKSNQADIRLNPKDNQYYYNTGEGTLVVPDYMLPGKPRPTTPQAKPQPQTPQRGLQQ